MVLARFAERFDVLASLFALAVVCDIKAVNLGQLAQASNPFRELILAPVAQDQRLGFAFGRLLNVDDGAGDGRHRACGQQVTAQQRVDEGALADTCSAKEDKRIGALGQNLLRFVNAELGLWHSSNQIVARAIDRLL